MEVTKTGGSSAETSKYQNSWWTKPGFSNLHFTASFSVMMAHRTNCTLVVDPDRVAAVRRLLEVSGCDLVISDDGLQHYFLDRDVDRAPIYNY